MHVEVMEPGLATSIQDLGRPGSYNVGIPPAGALDQRSAKLANALVGNPLGAAVLEAPYLGPKLKFSDRGMIAITGAKVPVLLNGEPASTWESLPVHAGDVLSFGFLEAGARIYIAVAGGFDVPPVLGSRSTYALGSLGGVGGRNIAAGDLLPVGPGDHGYVHRRIEDDVRPQHAKEIELRIVLGLYDYRLSDVGKKTLIASEWSLTQVADRTGFRYAGTKLEFVERVQPFGAGSDPSNIVDAGYPIGSIQVPSGSEPIILHRDAVSGGGYAMVGTVISVDMDRVGQSAPGTVTRLREVTLDEALDARRAQRAELENILAEIA